MVEPCGIVSGLRHAVDQKVGLFMLQVIGVLAEIGAEETDRPFRALFKDEPPVSNHQTAVFSGRSVEGGGKIQRAPRFDVLMKRETLVLFARLEFETAFNVAAERKRRFGRNSGRGDHQPDRTVGGTEGDRFHRFSGEAKPAEIESGHRARIPFLPDERGVGKALPAAPPVADIAAVLDGELLVTSIGVIHPDGTDSAPLTPSSGMEQRKILEPLVADWNHRLLEKPVTGGIGEG